ncbi:hypothetical protein EDD16DRAFT_1526015 [Pisolithus croceorrhizus]|nr:hypothetical protein EDD16DRAFT_1526015 [Pisolithus croceorrhizus]KAI6156185.1 hypothetical protein EDD17DRAFT_1512651 [Pisolithus thermaeus]
MTGMDLSGGPLIDSQGGGEWLVDGGEELDNELEGSLNEAAQKRKCTQKASSHWHSTDSQKQKPDSSQYKVFPSLSMLTMMILLTETILFYWDCINSSLEVDKDKYSGIREVVDWANKLASSKPLHTLLSQRSASNSCYAWLVSSTGMGSQIRVQAPPTSTCSSSHPPTPMINNPPEAVTLGSALPYLIHPQRQFIIGQMPCGSELDESAPSPPPPSQYTCSQWGHSSSDAQKALRNEDDYVELSGDEIDDGRILLVETKRGTKRDPCSRTDTNTSTALLSKQTKTQCMSSGQGSQCSGSGANKKFINSDLPLGAMNDNAWQHLFISALTYFAAGYDNPWTIPDDKLQHVLQEIWDIVYQDKVMHTVVIGGPVYSLISIVYIHSLPSPFSWQQAKQGLNFEDSMLCMKFASVMLKKNQFLFGQNRGTDNKTWTGLCADLIMSLFSGHMSFKMTQPGDVWTAVLPKGGQFEFGEAVWGMMTRCYLEPIKELSDKQFGLIVEDTQKFVKKVMAPTETKYEKMQ